MESMLYSKYIMEEFEKGHEFTFADFIEICNKLHFPIFEVAVTVNPFREPRYKSEARMYADMSYYVRQMPNWAARNYDYNADHPTYWLIYPDIAKGSFDVHAENKSSDYVWHFEVVGQCVVVHSKVSFTD